MLPGLLAEGPQDMVKKMKMAAIIDTTYLKIIIWNFALSKLLCSLQLVTLHYTQNALFFYLLVRDFFIAIYLEMIEVEIFTLSVEW